MSPQPPNITITLTPAQFSSVFAQIKGTNPSLTTAQIAAAQLLLPAPNLRSPAGYDTIAAYQAAVYADLRAAGLLSDTGWQSNHAQNLYEAMTEANFATFYGPAPVSLAQVLASDSAEPSS